jgi:hypothetical protein
VNNNLFGFSNTAANAVNNTIVQFYVQIENGVHSTFDGTAFSAPMIEFLRCIVGNKVFALEKGLAWLKENLNIRLPRVSPDVLKLSAGNISEIANPVSAAATLGGDGSGSGNRTAAEESGIMGRALVVSFRAQGRGVHVLRFPWRLCARRPHGHHPLDHQIEAVCYACVS